MVHSYVNWGSRSEDVKWFCDGETAPLGGGDIAPGGDIENPNAD